VYFPLLVLLGRLVPLALQALQDRLGLLELPALLARKVLLVLPGPVD
jgi:hypothetical protein